jgi:diketogulonate reductase-like aldo/keto reductase
MMKTLTFQVSDEVYKACQQMAAQYGRTEEEVVLEWLVRRISKPHPKLTEEESRAAWERLQRHMGAENLGYATGADNESIDADLAREYGNTHEEET